MDYNVKVADFTPGINNLFQGLKRRSDYEQIRAAEMRKKQDEEEAALKDQEARQEVFQALQSGKVQKVQEAFIKHPGLQKELQSAIDYQTEIDEKKRAAIKEHAIDTAAKVYSGQVPVRDGLAEHVGVIKDNGGKIDKLAETAGKVAENGEEWGKEQAGIYLAIHANDILKSLQSLDPESQTAPLPTPTDIDDFVEDADKESIRVTGKPLTPGDRNKARLKMKRAQAQEVRANRWAERSVDAETAEKIKYNEMLGGKLAEIETAADLLKAKGEISPEKKVENAKKQLGGYLATLSKHYVDLDSLGAILNVDKSTIENIFAAGKSSVLGQGFGRITGSPAQSVRAKINKLKPLLVQAIRASTDMGVRGMDSQKELEFYLQAATDEKTDIQSNMAAIAVLDKAYGTGEIAKQLEGVADIEVMKEYMQQGKTILTGIDPSKYDATGLAEGTVIKDPKGNRMIVKNGKFEWTE